MGRRKQAELWDVPPVERLLRASEARRRTGGDPRVRRREAANVRARTRRMAQRVAREQMPFALGATPVPAITTHAIGARAELIAARYLERAGYVVVERNYRCDVGELDLIVRRGETLVFVEVRSRASDDHGEAAEMVIRAKRRQVGRVAAAYLANERPRFRCARFDVVAVTGGEVIWLPDAWRLGDPRLLASR